MKCVGQMIDVSLINAAFAYADYRQVVHVAKLAGISHPGRNARRTCTVKRVYSLFSSSSCRLIHLLDWGYLKGQLGVLSEVFFALVANVVEKPLFNMLREADYETLFHELFANKGEPFQDWTKQDWICLGCIHKFFLPTVFRWWRARKAEGSVLVLVSL